MQLQPYTGEEKIVFALDCGTTMTAVSYVHLVPGSIPQFYMVNRWPHQEDAAGDCKFPTAVLYNAAGQAIAVGLKALENPDRRDGTYLARWFKLLLHDDNMRAVYNISAPALPAHLPIEKVYTDLLRHTFEHAVECFRSSTPDSRAIWRRVRTSYEIVFAIPNGWGERQQAFFRDVAVRAGLLTPSAIPNRLFFVTEAEASVHFVLEHLVADGYKLKVGDVFGVSDIGGSTVDTTMYKCEELDPQLRLAEVTASECVQAGSLFLDDLFEKKIRQRLAGSKFSGSEFIQEMVAVFETKAKRRFRGDEQEIIMHFGRNADNDPAFGISMGRLSLPATVMRQVFEETVSAISASILRLVGAHKCSKFLVVGGFAENVYLRNALERRVKNRAIDYIFTREPTKKAAAEGACLWRVHQRVSARAARYTYGLKTYSVYDGSSQSHRSRQHLSFVDEVGDTCLDGFFDILNQVMRRDNPQSRPLHRLFDSKPTDLGKWSMDLYASSLAKPGPWVETVDGKLVDALHLVCTLTADLSGVRSGLRKLRTRAGESYWRVDFSVEIDFGGTSLSAAIVWEERGTTKKGPVTLIPNSIITAA
ncbi:hypothetical protein AURDEDRAFT_171789 [Auricularia subglabra TFB-10046 SS5]|nr:hypothetical protein AURDEDRAFT_171789 [Auricularia subglabra TFB-10046 SS5]